MRDWQNLSYLKWECKYHIVWVPKYRCKLFYGKVRQMAGEIIREFCSQRDLKIIVENALPDNIYKCIIIPPKYSVVNAIGFLKGKSAMRLHRKLGLMGLGKHFRSRGCNLSTVRPDDDQIR